MCDQVDGEGERISSRQSIVLDLPPSCIEFCPAHPSYLVVGTYNLQKEEQQQQQQGEDENGEEDQKSIKSQSRNGSIIVFQLRDDGKVLVPTCIPHVNIDMSSLPSHQISGANFAPALCRFRPPFPASLPRTRTSGRYLRDRVQHGHHCPVQAHASDFANASNGRLDTAERPKDTRPGRRYLVHLLRMAPHHRRPDGHHHRCRGRGPGPDSRRLPGPGRLGRSPFGA